MWSKTRQILESRFAENLKGRVSFHYDVYRTKGCKEKHDWWTAIWAFNNEVEGIDDSRMLPYDLPMPDYRRLSNG